MYFSGKKTVFADSSSFLEPENTVFLIAKYEAYSIDFILGFSKIG